MPPKKKEEPKQDDAAEDGADRGLVEMELVLSYLKSKLGRYVTPECSPRGGRQMAYQHLAAPPARARTSARRQGPQGTRAHDTNMSALYTLCHAP